MKTLNGSIALSASDLVGHLNCRTLSDLDRAVAEGALARPPVWTDPYLEALRERGDRHEQAFVRHLEGTGLDVVRIDGVDVTDEGLAATQEAMTAGVSVIVQGALRKGAWSGRADILLRVETPSVFGTWSYEVVDTKLARETKAGAVLQLCVYSDLLEHVQGVAPEHMSVVTPWSDFEMQRYRFADYAAYYRSVRRSLEVVQKGDRPQDHYPDPKAHCDVCRWQVSCDQRRRADDHLSLVAGISALQINELNARSVGTVRQLAELPLPLQWKPDRGSPGSYPRVREQARIQVEARDAGEGKFEVLPIEDGFGLTRLPEPSRGDIFLDIEGDPFVGEHGIEYLLGHQYVEPDGEAIYHPAWALTREEERAAFEAFIDFVVERSKVYPDLHIYHYAPYEPAALKRLMGRYATREEAVDWMLRANVFVDLYSIVRHAVRASVDSYSIKRLEPFYQYERSTALTIANHSLANLQTCLELDDIASIAPEDRQTVERYNQDDCRSASALRDWLEGLRSAQIASGVAIARPTPEDGVASENVTAWLERINALVVRLTVDIPADVAARSGEQQARWVLANILDFHRREQKATWWEHFRLADLSADELLDERAAVSGLVFERVVGGTAPAPIHRYQFPPQDFEFREGDDALSLGGGKFGSFVAISMENRTVDIKKRRDTRDMHPEAVFRSKIVNAQVMGDSLVQIGDYVATHGISGEGAYQAARDLLLRVAPRLVHEAIQHENESTLDAAMRVARHLQAGVLPIQGPPGTGKTYTAARMICELVRSGRKVGITAASHKVVRNVIDETVRTANELQIALTCCLKVADIEDPQPRIAFTTDNGQFFHSLSHDVQVGGGTAWLWSRQEAFESVDVLFVDEAAQMSLANVLAVSQAARAIVLIGDPQQLDSPIQGTHPDGCDASALHHVLGDEQTIAPDKGLFLAETWRLHPDICAFTSELFYAGKLHPIAGLSRQVIRSPSLLAGSGLRYVPIPHTGNQNASIEEAQAVCCLVEALLAGGSTWIDRDGQEKDLTIDDILIITPYNAQVMEIKRVLPNAKVGTVDKFQGQQAPIAIYSTASSSHADAPRGMEFLYSLNRFNVATSRAKCLSVLVCSPGVFEAECRTPRQMQLANAFCRYREMAVELAPI
ncbi:TM0106 family RecB-like putative nuclease [Dokdonella soli]